MSTINDYSYGKLVGNRFLTELLKKAFDNTGKIVESDAYIAFYDANEMHWVNKVAGGYFYGKLVKDCQLTVLLEKAFNNAEKVVFDDAYVAFYYAGAMYWTTANDIEDLKCFIVLVK